MKSSPLSPSVPIARRVEKPVQTQNAAIAQPGLSGNALMPAKKAIRPKLERYQSIEQRRARLKTLKDAELAAEPANVAEPPSFDTDILHRTIALLGGPELLGTVSGPSGPHEMILRGLPRPALECLLGGSAVLSRSAALETAIGISLRTFQRSKANPAGRLSAEQSGRIWSFAHILALAIEVFGTRDSAERWLEQPAMGLDRQRPIDLLATVAGARIVEDFLGRLAYGVYT